MTEIFSMKQLESIATDLIEKEAVNQVRDYLSTVDLEVLSKSKLDEILRTSIKHEVARTDIRTLIKDTVTTVVKTSLSNLVFPDASIPLSAINFDTGKINGSFIEGGIQRSFSSLGIDDQATDCNLTVMDGMVVVEETLVTKNIEVKENLVVEGDLILKGDINTDSKGFHRIVNQAAEKTKNAIANELMDSLASATAQKMKSDGIEVSKITIDGHTIIDGNALGKSIVTSNLQRVGYLQELQVRGEALLSDSLYTTKSRVGINTTEPSRSLSVWDEDCELVMCKHERQTGYIGSIRSQKVILGSDSQTNILLEVDGSTRIYDLHIGKTKIQSADVMPNHTGTRGEIVFNAVPELGKPYGWVCLGGERWACMPALTD